MIFLNIALKKPQTISFFGKIPIYYVATYLSYNLIPLSANLVHLQKKISRFDVLNSKLEDFAQCTVYTNSPLPISTVYISSYAFLSSSVFFFLTNCLPMWSSGRPSTLTPFFMLLIVIDQYLVFRVCTPHFHHFNQVP